MCIKTLSRQTQDKLHTIYWLTNKISKASEEEEQAKLELSNCETEYEGVHGPLADRMDELRQTYISMVNLELNHDNIRKEGNIIAYEMKTGTPSDDKLYHKRVNILKGKLESHRTTLRYTCKKVHPSQSGIRQLHYRTVATRDFVSDMHDKYAHYKNAKSICTMLKKLEYTMK